MVFAFGHIIGAWLVGKTIELATKRRISKNTWFFLIIGGILPDIDFIFQFIFKTSLHRGITHSIFFAILIPIIVYSIFKLIKNKKSLNYTLFLTIGILTHIFLDFLSPTGVPLLWPYTKMFIPSLSLETSSSTLDGLIDMFLGTGWILYLSLKNKIQF
jgi:membrane-bound metal-dependent hydrolase YbcI (DUF457 family)